MTYVEEQMLSANIVISLSLVNAEHNRHSEWQACLCSLYYYATS